MHEIFLISQPSKAFSLIGKKSVTFLMQIFFIDVLAKAFWSIALTIVGATRISPIFLLFLNAFSPIVLIV